MNIIGEGFPDQIVEQVKKRQEIYGSGYAKGAPLRTHEEIIYLNANTSWCKLVSSVDIGEPPTFTNASPPQNTNNFNPELNIYQNVPLQTPISAPGGVSSNSNDQLARQYVLFNGTFNTNTKTQRAGIATDKNVFDNEHAYGIGGTDFGIRPMMGIQSANIKFLNRGSIRQATVKVKAWNTIQFNIIDSLYLRLGFSILLEWGHSMWYDNKGELHKANGIENSLALDFLNGKGTYQDFLNKINIQRLASNGNYDAMFGKVTNYHWSFLPDGSYDITINLISIGDVVESFKMNVFNNTLNIESNSNSVTNPGDPTSGKNPQDLTNKEVIALYANSSKIALYFNSLIDPSVGSAPQTSNQPPQDPFTLSKVGNIPR
jgi:hypothetical protein